MYFVRRLKGLNIGEAWFSLDEIPSKKRVAYFFQSMRELNTEKVFSDKIYTISMREAQTLFTNLSQSADELLQKCDSTTRYEIRRAKKESVICKSFSSDVLKSDRMIIHSFEAQYAQMHRDKNMAHSSVEDYLLLLANANALTVTIAYIDGEAVAYHTYVCAEGIARLLHSVSNFREGDNSMRNAVARANRLLHYEDMLWFKERGYHTYDWGGYSECAEVANISAFKKGFGGTLGIVYNSFVTQCGWFYNLYCLAQRVLSRFRRS